MRSWRPTVDEERTVALRALAEGWRKSGLAAGDVAGALPAPAWNTSSIVARIVFFVLTAVGVSAMFAFFFLLHIPLRGTLTAAIAIGLAEVLIRNRRFLCSGVEEALWIFALLYAISDLPSSGAKEALLLFALAFLIAGWRTLNSLSVLVAIILAGVYVGAKTEASVAGMVFAAAAVAATFPAIRPIRRPWLEEVAGIALVALPLAAYVSFRIEESSDHLGWMPLAVLAVLLVWMVVVPARRRCRPGIVGAMLLVAVIGYELIDRLPWGVDAKLLLPGIALLALALVADRALRSPRHGITSRKLSEASSLRALEMIGATALSAAQQPAAPATAQPIGKGGEYGGAGASGEY